MQLYSGIILFWLTTNDISSLEKEWKPQNLWRLLKILEISHTFAPQKRIQICIRMPEAQKRSGTRFDDVFHFHILKSTMANGILNKGMFHQLGLDNQGKQDPYYDWLVRIWQDDLPWLFLMVPDLLWPLHISQPIMKIVFIFFQDWPITKQFARGNWIQCKCILVFQNTLYVFAQASYQDNLFFYATLNSRHHRLFER